MTISVVGTNDIHGALLGADHMGGMELLGGYLNNLRTARQADGGVVLLIDAGDMWQGTLESNMTEGASVVATFNALGYTAAAFGNHEFDFGPVGPLTIAETPEDDPQGVMKVRASEAEFPMLAANLIDIATGEPIAWDNVHPSVIVDANGVKVGIIGLVTTRLYATTILANTRGLRVDPLAETIQQQAKQLRADGATVVIVTAHAGSRCDQFDDPNDLSSCDAQQEIFRAANDLPSGAVDFILGGHTHQGIAHFVNDIAVASAFSRNSAFSRVDLIVDTATGKTVERRIHPPQPLCRYQSPGEANCAEAGEHASPAVYESKEVAPDSAVAATFAYAVADARSLKQTSIGIHLQTPFVRTSIPESSIGNLMTDALRGSSDDAEFAIHNTVGGIRADLPAGDMNYGNLYEMFPFDNRMVTVEFSGAELRQVLHSQMVSSNWRAGFSGGTVTARCNDAKLEITITRDSGSPVRDDEYVRVVTADFLLSGGDAIFIDVIPDGGFAIPGDAPQIRDVLETWLRERGGSVSADMFFDDNNRRFVYDTPPPITCSTSP